MLVRRGGGSLDLKCYCFNALTGEGMRAVSSLTALTSLELRGAASLGAHAHAQELRHAEAGVRSLLWHLQVCREACCGISKYVPKLL